MHGLSQTYGDRIKFVRINIRDPKYAPLKAKLGDLVAPSFFLIDPKGQVLGSWDDSLSIDDVKQALDAVGK